MAAVKVQPKRPRTRAVARHCWRSAGLLVVALAVLVTALRLLLPLAGNYRQDIADWVSEALGQEVAIEKMRAGWHGFGPTLVLQGVTLFGEQHQALLKVALARVDVDLFASLLNGQLTPGRLTVREVELVVVREHDGHLSIGGVRQTGTGEDGALARWLNNQRWLALENSIVHWRDLKHDGLSLEFRGVDLELRRNGARRVIRGGAELPGELGQRFTFSAEVFGALDQPRLWEGRAYVRGQRLRPGAVLAAAPPLNVRIPRGDLDFDLWVHWSQGQATLVEGSFTARDLAVAAAAHHASTALLRLVQGQLRWQQQTGTGWALDLSRLFLVSAAAPLPPPPAQLRLEYHAGGEGAGRLEAGLSRIRAEELARLWIQGGWGAEQARATVRAAAVEGEFKNVYLRLEWSGDTAPRWLVRGEFEDTGSQAHGRVPGGRGFSGSVVSDNQRGVLRLDSRGAVFSSHLFRESLPVGRLQTVLYWHREGGGWRLRAPDIRLENEDIKIRAALNLSLPGNGHSPDVDFVAGFDEAHLEHASRYLPAAVMPPRLAAWLDRAVVGGRAGQGAVQLRGPLRQFPFDQGGGRFEVRFNVRDGILEYMRDWPRLEEVEAGFLFRGRSLDVEVAAAKTRHGDIDEARLRIPDFKARPAVLIIDGTARGDASDAIDFVRETPLRKRLGKVVAHMEASGEARLRLEMKWPLGTRKPLVKGSLAVRDSRLRLRDADLLFTQVNGALDFDQHGFSAEKLSGRILGQPAEVSIRQELGEAGRVTVFDGQGEAAVRTVADRFAPFLVPYLSGAAAWQGSLRLPGRGGAAAELSVSSTLAGARLALPRPLGKAAGEVRALTLRVPLPPAVERPLRFDYGGVLAGVLALGGPAGAPWRGELRFGAAPAVVPEAPTLRLAGVLPYFSYQDWEPLLWPPEKNRAAPGPVGLVDLAITQAVYSGRVFHDVRLSARRGAQAWEADVKAREVAGRVRLPHDLSQAVVANLTHLELVRLNGGQGKGTGADPRRLPPLELDVQALRYGALELGRLRLRASRIPTGLRFDDISTVAPAWRFTGQGSWLWEGGGPHSSFTISLDADDAGGVLAGLGYGDMIQSGKGSATLALHWDGPPAAFDLARAQGSIEFDIKKGRMLEVDPGAGRLLGLLSFQALPRRLALDFSDFFKKGFAFDRLGGLFAVEDGNAYTENLFMEGPAATIVARGRVGIATEDYDQRVIVVPHVSAGLPLAGAIAGGVGAGVAVLFLERLLKPKIDELTRVEYRVTGPWRAPVIERVATAGTAPAGSETQQ
ncbi:MAG TPA: TIGR02099 family protein [Gammaproteobacteria bacterium]|nr:TIGR02099 family protein [Gammaproteobacteria bacterium]